MTMHDNSKITLMEMRTTEAPFMKEELYDEGEADHCFVYDMVKTHGGWYSEGSCVHLPFL
jgi:hypothetical protein